MDYLYRPSRLQHICMSHYQPLIQSSHIPVRHSSQSMTNSWCHFGPSASPRMRHVCTIVGLICADRFPSPIRSESTNWNSCNHRCHFSDVCQGHPHGLQPQPINRPFNPRRVKFRSLYCHPGGTLNFRLKQSSPNRSFHRTNRPFWGAMTAYLLYWVSRDCLWVETLYIGSCKAAVTNYGAGRAR
ncbi:hypothetical protein BO83DRAFT_227451 [Aspergillus eucalypticola CBS 122712]|uniref:Uncharacterized protein n=1 Tax=Aspergillus eucalypticola (strain CBS 122712 / IBT 29274) TaxID=1448314 RepID=A0A317VVK6_ASPEC|nr:uncharacterized protein BO83DRAFT_227451 [Aspergillus eucalypticola CBS 122712]PWY77835.1 hypothetical protein BO83DRAFT_227451 [Aspergillus eucalypticola CBS 122712]